MATLIGLFTDIADAIRSVESSSGRIPALDFPERIRKLSASSGVDATALKASISAATSAKNSTKVQGGGDYDFGTNVATQDDIDAITAAIAKAQAAYDAYGTGPVTQSDLDAAKTELDAALETFRSSLKPLVADTSGLTAQQDRYTSLSSGVTVSTDGKDVAFGSKWVTSAAKSAADAAIEAAQSAVASATKQSQVDAAVATLKSALDTYEQAVKTATADTAALDAAITAANAAKADVQTSDNEGKDLPSGSQYVTSAEMKALNDAIEAATAAKTGAANQNAIDTATSNLTGATETFTAAIKTNWAPPENIADASWADIEQLSAMAAENSDQYKSYIGQTKVIDMSSLGNSCTNVTAMIIGVGHDVDPQGKKLGFTFQLRDGLPYQTFTMNSSNTTTGGWRDSLMRSTNLPKVKAAMPEELRSRLKTMVKKTSITNSGTTATETQDDIALLSVREVFGSAESGQTWWAVEGEQYEWYATHNTPADRIINSAAGSASNWWLRSVYSTTSFCTVNSNGNRNSGNASNQYMPCACFSV